MVHTIDGRDHPSCTPPANSPEAAREAYADVGAMLQSPVVNGTLVKTPPRPFYRTGRGGIIIIFAFFAIVAGIVGFAVGGSLLRARGRLDHGPATGGLGTATTTTSDWQGSPSQPSTLLGGSTLFGGATGTSVQSVSPTGTLQYG